MLIQVGSRGRSTDAMPPVNTPRQPATAVPENGIRCEIDEKFWLSALHESAPGGEGVSFHYKLSKVASA